MILRYLRNVLLLFLILPCSSVFAQTGDVAGPRLLLPVKQGGKWGYADTMRRIIISPQFDAANTFRAGIAIVEQNRKAYAIDTTGKILTPGFDQLVQLEDTILSFYLNVISDTLGGWGISTVGGKLILPPAYDEIVGLGAELFAFRKDTVWGAVDRNGKQVVPMEFDSITMLTTKFLFTSGGKNCGLYRLDGFCILENKYRQINRISDNLFLARPAEKKPGWGAVNSAATIVVPFEYDTIQAINRYFLSVKKGDSLACFFPAAGGNPTSFSYTALIPIDFSWIRLYDGKKNCGLADSMGRMLIPPMYQEITIGGTENWFVRDTSGRWGIYTVGGTLLVPPAYTRIQPFRDKVAIMYAGKNCGLINVYGEVLEPPAIQEILIRGKNVKLLRPDGSAVYLTLDNNGRVIERSSYDEMHVIRVKGREAAITQITGPPAIRPAMGVRGPRFDSLQWFRGQNQKWGMRNSFTGDTIYAAVFDLVQTTWSNKTIVGINDTLAGITLDEYQTYGQSRVGLVDDSSGKMLIKPRFVTLFAEDLSPHGFKGFIRGILPGGKMVLVSTDGSERTMSYTWIETPHDGYARICLGGTWTLNGPGEPVDKVGQMINAHHLAGRMSFGKAVVLISFLETDVLIAGGKWGYIDSTGHVAIQPQYDAARSSFRTTGIVKLGKKWGMIDMTGATRIPFNYDALGYMKTDTGTAVLAQNANVRYGYINQNGNVVIPADLKMSKQLGGGFIGFTRKGKWGVMNSKGETVIDETYHEILPYSEGVAAVRRGNKWGYIDTTGAEVIAPQFSKAGEFHTGFARVVLNQRWGFIDRNGALVIAAKFLQAGDFHGSVAPAKTHEGWGLINIEGKWIQKPVYDKIAPIDTIGTPFFIIRSGNYSGIANGAGKILIAPSYEAFLFLGAGRIAYRSGLFWGMADTLGSTITNLVFDRIRPFSEGFAAASQNGLWGFIRPNGKFAIAPQYKTAGSFQENRAYVLTDRSLVCFIDSSGRKTIQLRKGIALGGYSEGKILALKFNKRNEIDKMYFVTRHGVMLNRMEYKVAMPFEGTVARVSPGGTRWGLVSYTGYYLVKPRFTVLDPFSNGLARFQMATSQGLFGLDGTPYLPVAYDWISYDPELKLIRYETGNALGYLHTNGSVCWPIME
jgi:hypothetical protein